MPARRFLAPQARSGNGHGYLTQPERQYPQAPDPVDVVERIASATAMCDEPEAPSSAWVDAEADLAVERNRLRLLHRAMQAREARQTVTPENRIKDAQRRAKVKRMDITSDLFFVRKSLVRGKDGDAIKRLEGIELRLDGVAGLETAA